MITPPILKKEGFSLKLSTVALMLIAWQVLTSGNNSSQQNTPQSSPLDTISAFLSDDTKNILSCVSKLSDKQCSQEDRTGAIFQIMTNPQVMNIANNLFGGNGEQQEQKHDEQTNGYTNGEGYRFEQPSPASQEFFRPIDNIADAEVKHKLYWFYENWYIK